MFFVEARYHRSPERVSPQIRYIRSRGAPAGGPAMVKLNTPMFRTAGTQYRGEYASDATTNPDE